MSKRSSKHSERDVYLDVEAGNSIDVADQNNDGPSEQESLSYGSLYVGESKVPISSDGTYALSPATRKSSAEKNGTPNSSSSSSSSSGNKVAYKVYDPNSHGRGGCPPAADIASREGVNTTSPTQTMTETNTNSASNLLGSEMSEMNGSNRYRGRIKPGLSSSGIGVGGGEDLMRGTGSFAGAGGGSGRHNSSSRQYAPMDIEMDLDDSDDTEEESSTGGTGDPAPDEWSCALVWLYIQLYFSKMAGVEGQTAPPYKPWYHMMISATLCFFGILLISVVDRWYVRAGFTNVTILSAAYASSTVILFEAYKSPSAQPRNLLGGYSIATTVGVSVRFIFEDYLGWNRVFVGSIAVLFAVIAMNLMKAMHPPAGSAALIAVIGGPGIKDLGYGYVLTSTGGAFLLLSLAIVVNNLFTTRRYPWYWL